MTWEDEFGIANTLALAGWLALVLLPRWRGVLLVTRYLIPGILAVGYAVLVFLYFFKVEGGGFGTLAEVKALLSSDPVLLGGWIHYLAFDLFIGTWIAERSDRLGLSRVVQAPVLLTTFMFGPIGLLLHLMLEATLAARSAGTSHTTQAGATP